MSPLQGMSDAIIMAEIEAGLEEGKPLRAVLAEQVFKFTHLLAGTLKRQGMHDARLSMVPAVFHCFQMQVGALICSIDGKDEIDENDPLVVEFMEKMQPVADMVNGLIERAEHRN